jgi:hypothetical protein
MDPGLRFFGFFSQVWIFQPVRDLERPRGRSGVDVTSDAFKRAAFREPVAGSRTPKSATTPTEDAVDHPQLEAGPNEQPEEVWQSARHLTGVKAQRRFRLRRPHRQSQAAGASVHGRPCTRRPIY